jgi:type III secretion system low calcium response chaperone LcrH/SycD
MSDTSQVKTFEGFSKEALSAMSALAYQAYTNGLYNEALPFFRMLTAYRPEHRPAWMGLGATLQMLKDYTEAIAAYGVAALMDENDPYVHLHAAECYHALNDGSQALVALNSAILTATEDACYRQLLAQLKLLQTCWHEHYSVTKE